MAMPPSPPIRIRDACQNNIRNIDLDIPTGELAVVTGPCSSGKSSLAFDTLYAERQRRYVETLCIFSPYTRRFLDRMDKPQVDAIEGVPPAIAIDVPTTVTQSSGHDPGIAGHVQSEYAMDLFLSNLAVGTVNIAVEAI